MEQINASDLGERDKLLNSVGFFNSKHVELANKSLSTTLTNKEQLILHAFKHEMNAERHGAYNSVSSWTDFGVSSLYDIWEDQEHPLAFDGFIPSESCFYKERLREQRETGTIKPYNLNN